MRRRMDTSMPPELTSPDYVDDAGRVWTSTAAWAMAREMWQDGELGWDAGFAAPDEPMDAGDI